MVVVAAVSVRVVSMSWLSERTSLVRMRVFCSV